MRLFFLTFTVVNLIATVVVISHMLDLLKPFKIRLFLAAIYIFLGFSVMAGRIFHFNLPDEISAWLTRVGYVWMGLLTYMFVWSLVCLVLKIWHIGPVSNYNRIIFYAVEVGLCLSLFGVGFFNASVPKVIKYNIATEKNVPLRVVQISDCHLGYMVSAKMFERVVNKIESVNPDILLITGDFLENEREYAQRKHIGRSLYKLKPKYGIWAVNGNHDFFGGIEKSLYYTSSLGITTLRDTSVVIDDNILLIGQEDRAARRFGITPMSLDSLLQQITVNEKLTILMNHQIKDHSEYENRGLDLVLSGHTHSGQIFPYNLVVARMFDISHGLEKRGDSYFYVSCGTGYWGIPMRLGTRSEIVVFEIE